MKFPFGTDELAMSENSNAVQQSGITVFVSPAGDGHRQNARRQGMLKGCLAHESRTVQKTRARVAFKQFRGNNKTSGHLLDGYTRV